VNFGSKLMMAAIGTDWLNNMATEFTAKTGVAVHVEFSTTLLDRIESDLKNGSDYDLYMSHGINWQSFAASGYLAPISMTSMKPRSTASIT
jgi:maltose-binding protein MalE